MTKTPAKKTAKKTAAKKVAVLEPAASPKASPKKIALPKTAVKKAAAKKVAPKKAKPAAIKKVSEIKKMDAGQMLAMQVAQGMFEKKGENIRILDMRKLPGASSDYFVISHASNDKQVDAIAKSVEEEVKKHLNENPLHREGFENMEWILLDYFNVVAHIFQEEKRDFYGIEQLWGDAEEIIFKGK